MAQAYRKAISRVNCLDARQLTRLIVLGRGDPLVLANLLTGLLGVVMLFSG